jgi:serine/threonine protein kinase
LPRPQPLTAHDPQQVGPYHLTGFLGAGGQGSVYLGETPDGSRVAVKVLHAHFARDETARVRFVREVETARKVADFTARVLDVAVHHGLPYIVSEYIPGESLHDLIVRDGPYDPSRLTHLASGTLTALVAIHAAQIVHCDFKPANVPPTVPATASCTASSTTPPT